MFLGIDVSTYLEQQRIAHPCYFKDGKEVNPFSIFKNNGIAYLRTRIWNDPYDEDGEPYLGGTCDLDNFIKLAKELTPYKFKHIVDFHYSDHWVDPSKQFLPKAWQKLSFNELVDAVYIFTRDSLKRISEEKIKIDMVQIGNEITHGFLWPYGELLYKEKRIESFDRFATLLKAGIKGVKEIFPKAKIIIHLEQSYDQFVYRDIISNLLSRDVKFDILGSSYYPFWHHGFDEYFSNMDMVRKEFNLEVMNVEVGYPFTVLDYKREANHNKVKHMVINADNVKEYEQYMPYPASKQGQALFLQEFIRLAKEHGMLGVCYWEPIWIPAEGLCWGTTSAQRYQHHPSIKETRLDWSNMCLFDYDGNALPALDKFKL